MATEKPASRGGAVLVGLGVAAFGLLVVVVAITKDPARLETPRWVAASMGGAFLVFGGWTAAVYRGGYDPEKPDAKLPSPAVQLAVLVPCLLLFAAPFHWVAFWPGPRTFQSSFSLPFLSGSGISHGSTGRVIFGAGAILVDFFIIAVTVTLVRRIVRLR
jgi:hypothetical protein